MALLFYWHFRANIRAADNLRVWVSSRTATADSSLSIDGLRSFASAPYVATRR